MTVRVILALALIFAGLAAVLLTAVGLYRFRDSLDMLQAGALADTMGVLLMLGGLMLLCGLTVHTAKLALTLVILWATNPVSAHLIARMELITGRGIEPQELHGEGEREL